MSIFKAVDLVAVEAVRLATAGGADPNERDALGRSALFLAVYLGMVNTARALIEAGASPNAPCISGSEQRPLAFAVLAEDAAMTRMLCECGADVEDTGHGEPALRRVLRILRYGDALDGVCRALLDAGADTVAAIPRTWSIYDIEWRQGQAVAAGHEDLSRALNAARVEIIDRQLSQAVASGNEAAARALMPHASLGARQKAEQALAEKSAQKPRGRGL